jgi:tetratricopeptide (TPR) repeat protein
MSLDVDKALRRAARLIENAELTAAETIYKDILTSFPKNSKALRGYQRMKSTDVVTRPEGSAPSPQQMQAVMALCHQGQFTEVLSKLDLLLEAFPDASAVYNLQGASRAALGRYDGAIDSFKRAITLKPDDASSYFNIGNVQKETGALDAAIANYDSALKIKPDHVAALRNKGNVLQDKGDARAAIASYKSAIEIEPQNAATHYNMGVALQGLGDIKAAVDCYKQALRIKPDYAAAYNNMGNAQKDTGDTAAAIDSLKKALNINPNYAEIYSNMGHFLAEIGQPSAAIGSFKQALKIKPDYAEAYNNLGIALLGKGELDAAMDSYKQALKIKPDYTEAYTNRAHAFLKSGDFALGWQDYEWRWKISNLDSAPLTTDRPVWQPQTAGRVLLWPEQGVGDMVMFASIIPELYECSEQIIVQTDARLIPLFRRAFPREIVYCDHTEIIAENRYDSHIPMGSLPRYFRPDSASFQKASGAYLKPDAARAARLRQNLLGATGQSLCGISCGVARM